MPQSRNNQVKISCKRVVRSHFSWVLMEGLRDNDIGIFKGRRLGKASQERDEVDLEAAEEAKSFLFPTETECLLRLSSGCPSGNR